jgi:hypothetical protein
MSFTKPPRVTRSVLRRALPRDVRDSISGDLDEVFARDSEAIGAPAARRKYRRKAVSLAGRFLIERLRARS